MYVTWCIHTYEVTHYAMWNDSSIHVTWRIDVCDMTHSYIWRDSWMYVTWFIPTYDMAHWYTWHDSFSYMTWLIDVFEMTHGYCDVTHSYVRTFYFCERRLINIWDMARWCMRNDSFIFVPWRIAVREMTHPQMSHFVYVWTLPIYDCVMWRIWKWHIHNRDVTHSYLNNVFLWFEWSTREKKKHQRIFSVFMPYVWVRFWAVNASCHTHECHTHEGVCAMSHIWMSECCICHTMHVTHMNKGVRVFMSHVWMRQCFSSLWMSHVTHINEEASENVFQVRTSDRTKELWRDDRYADLYRHASRSCPQKAQSLFKRIIHLNTTAWYLWQRA